MVIKENYKFEDIGRIHFKATSVASLTIKDKVFVRLSVSKIKDEFIRGERHPTLQEQTRLLHIL